MIRISTGLLCAALLSALGSVDASAAVIGLDARGGSVKSVSLSSGSMYSSLRNIITAQGHSFVPVNSFTAAGLAGLDALILRQPLDLVENYTPTEIQDIQAFVAAGQGLLAIGEGGYYSSSTTPKLNSLVAPYGVQFAPFATHGSGLIVQGFAAHPLTAGLASIGLDFLRALNSIGTPAIDLTTGSNDVLAVVDAAGGGGNVVLFCDSSCWTDPGAGSDYSITDLDNTLLFTNILTHITTPSGIYGDGCPGSGGFTPKLGISPVPLVMGNQATLSITEGLGGTDVFLFFGLTQAALPMGGGCLLNVTPLLPLVLRLPLGGSGPGNGTLVLNAVVPAGTSGATFTMQAFVIDFTTPLGFSNSAGYEAHVQ